MKRTKLSRDQIKVELTLFADASHAKYQSHAYAAGYYESLLAVIMAELPVHKQLELVTQIRTSSVLQPV